MSVQQVPVSARNADFQCRMLRSMILQLFSAGIEAHMRTHGNILRLCLSTMIVLCGLCLDYAVPEDLDNFPCTIKTSE